MARAVHSSFKLSILETRVQNPPELLKKTINDDAKVTDTSRTVQDVADGLGFIVTIHSWATNNFEELGKSFDMKRRQHPSKLLSPRFWHNLCFSIMMITGHHSDYVSHLCSLIHTCPGARGLCVVPQPRKPAKSCTRGFGRVLSLSD